jgi:dihydroorotase
MKLIDLMSTRPAQIVKLSKGTLQEGADADMTIVDPRLRWTIDAGQFRSKSCNCPFGGRPVTGRAVTTIVGGQVKWQLER